MKKTVLGVAMVVVFCITWWLVAGEAWRLEQAMQKELQAHEAYHRGDGVWEEAWQALSATPQGEQVERADRQVRKAKQAAEGGYPSDTAPNRASPQTEQVKQAAKQALEAAKQAYGDAINAGTHAGLQASMGPNPTQQDYERAQLAAQQAYQALAQAEREWERAREQTRVEAAAQGLQVRQATSQARLEALEQAKQALEQAKQARDATPQGEVVEQAARARERLEEQVGQVQRMRMALERATGREYCSPSLPEPIFIHFRLMASWGIGAGLLADVLLLIGALAWSKLTAKA